MAAAGCSYPEHHSRQRRGNIKIKGNPNHVDDEGFNERAADNGLKGHGGV